MWLLSWEFIWGPACLFSSHPRSEMIYKGRRQCWSNGRQGRRIAQIWLPLKSSLWQSEGQLGVEGVERGVLLTRWGKVRERLNLGIWRRDLQAVTLLLPSGGWRVRRKYLDSAILKVDTWTVTNVWCHIFLITYIYGGSIYANVNASVVGIFQKYLGWAHINSHTVLSSIGLQSVTFMLPTSVRIGFPWLYYK